MLLIPPEYGTQRYVLPSSINRACINLVSGFNLSFAALDFIVTPDDQHVFLELNLSGQWGWIERALEFPITNAMLDQLLGSYQ